MQYRQLGRTDLRVSALSFGAGPVPNLMTSDSPGSQEETLGRALEIGVNWIDTAASYGQGRSEASLGRALQALDAAGRVHVATKARVMPEETSGIREAVRRSIAGSCERLGIETISLLQVHNSITASRGDEPTSLTPADALGPILDEFRAWQDQGVVRHLGLTGIGHPDALRQVIRSGEFDTIQIPYNLLNPSAGQAVPRGFDESQYGNVIADCAAEQMGVFAIRVFAGGALAGQPPSAHTFKTPFFPLDLYRRDEARAAALLSEHGSAEALRAEAVRFVLGHESVTSAIIGFGSAAHVDEAVNALKV